MRIRIRQEKSHDDADPQPKDANVFENNFTTKKLRFAIKDADISLYEHKNTDPHQNESQIPRNQCCGSGSARIHIHFGQLDTDPHWEYGSGSGRAKITYKSEENSSIEVPDVLF
jgi:hypothetical protein